MHANHFLLLKVARAAFIAAALLLSSPALALSVKDFNAMPSEQAANFLGDYIFRAVTNFQSSDPARAGAIKDYFYGEKKAKGIDGEKVEMMQGLRDFYVTLDYVEKLGEQGKLDVSKVAVEAIVDDVIREKFPPHPAPSITPSPPKMSDH